MSVWFARVELAHQSGLPEDTVVNGFVINDNESEIDTEGPLNVTAALDHFYNQAHDVAGVNRKLCDFISPVISRAALGVTVKYYELTGALGSDVHGSPFVVDAFTLGAALGTALPAEVAAVLTLRGQDWNTAAVEAPDGADPDAKVDRPKQRHTGRLFIGPLGNNALETVSNRCRLAATLRGTMLNSCSVLQEELSAQEHVKAWAIWSRKDATIRRVVRGEVDNAFDTQRRRGEAPSIREATGAL